MKKHLFQLLAVSLIMTLSSAFVFAVPDKRDEFSINVPFDFQVGENTFEAGKYKIFREDARRIVIESRKTGKQRYYLGNFDGRYAMGGAYKLRFHKYGNTHFLRKITARGSGFDLPKTKAEKYKSKKMKKKKVVLGP